MGKFIQPKRGWAANNNDNEHGKCQAQEEGHHLQQENGAAAQREQCPQAKFRPHPGGDVRQGIPGNGGHEKDAKRSRTTSSHERTLGRLPLRPPWASIFAFQPNTKEVSLGDFVKGVNTGRTRPKSQGGETGAVEEPAKAGKLMREAMQLARDPSALERVKQRLQRDFNSSSSRRSKEVKRQEILELAKSVSPCGRPLPLSVEIVEGVSAAMKAAGFKSGAQYLGELRLAHVEAGYSVEPWLTRSFKLCKKALERDTGPTRRAPEIKAGQVSSLRAKGGQRVKKRLQWPVVAYLWAMTWMLREIELRGIRWSHIQVKPEGKLVTLNIHKSKTDQAGQGLRRTLTCCGKAPCDPVCAWALVQRLMKHKGEAEEPVFITNEGKHPSKQDVVNSWKWVAAAHCTGHSARRSGAMHYVRCGMCISELAYLGRWKSSVVLSYAEEALEEVAANRAVSVTPQGKEDSHQREHQTVKESNQGSEESTLPLEAGKRASLPRQDEGLAWSCLANPPKALWVVTKRRGTSTRPVHLVTNASWAIPIARWSTACGWLFAEKSTEFRFVPSPALTQKRCRKCLELKDRRD